MGKLEEEKSGIWQGFGVDGEIWFRFPTFEMVGIGGGFENWTR